MEETRFTIPKPRLPIWPRLLFGLVTLGLFGLGIVAFETFSLFHNRLVAAIFASIIEVGAAVDAIGLSQGLSRKNWWLVPALAITLVVSGWYNYATVERAAAALDPPVANPWILGAVGIGPLASLFFMAIGVGVQLAEHERAVEQWHADRQAWLDARAARAEAQRLEAQRAAQSARERETQIQAQLDYQKEKARLESEERLRAAEIAARERQARREARLEAARLTSTPGVEVPGSEGGSSRKTYADFVELLRTNGSHAWKNEELARKFQVSTRTITTWRRQFAEESEAAGTPN